MISAKKKKIMAIKTCFSYNFIKKHLKDTSFLILS